MEDEIEALAGRTRDRTATRDALLESAARLFCAHGYDGTGIRAVAAAAGVTAALPIRYFGSKRELFAAVVDRLVTGRGLLDCDVSGYGARLASVVLAKKQSDGGLDPLQLMLRSSSSPVAAAIVRDRFDAEFVGPLADRLGPPDGLARAGAVVSILTGAAVLRMLLASAASTGPAAVGQEMLLARAIQQIVDGGHDP